MKITSRIPLVSVIVTTKNEEKNIGNCLESIKRQTYPQERIEIIVVDNNSTDKTKEIARRYTRKVYNRGPERSAQRNYGMIEKAKGKYVMYLDADMILAKTVIERAVKKLEIDRNILALLVKHVPIASGRNMSRKRDEIKGNKIVALYIPEVVLGNSFWSRVRRFERSFYDGTVIDCARIMRKDVFEKVGGFDASLTGPEDWDLDKKLRKMGKVELVGRYDFEEINKKIEKIEITRNMVAKGDRNMPFGRNKLAGASEIEKLVNLTDEAVIFHNEAEFNLQEYLQKKAYYGQSFAKYIKKWGKDDPDIKKQLGFWYRYFGVFTEKGKWKRLIRHPILAIGMFFLRFLVGWQYLKGKVHSKS